MTFELGVAQEARAGEGADERHLGGGGDRLRGGAVGVPTGPISAKTLSSSISFLVGDRVLGLVAVVDADQLDLAPVNAALLVDLVECGVDAGLHALAERRGRSLEHGRGRTRSSPKSRPFRRAYPTGLRRRTG